jgi:hypothetical protein
MIIMHDQVISRTLFGTCSNHRVISRLKTLNTSASRQDAVRYYLSLHDFDHFDASENR